jgi:hypothetical protein
MHRWYSIRGECEVVDHEPVTLDEAIAIARDYLGRADTVYQSAEEGTEATMFGIGSNTSFIEFGLISSSHISCRFEVAKKSGSWLSRFFSGVFQRDSKLTSEAQMIDRIREFYTTPLEDLMARYK